MKRELVRETQNYEPLQLLEIGTRVQFWGPEAKGLKKPFSRC